MLLLIDAIPDLIEIIFVILVSFAAGAAAGFFLFRIKNRREIGVYEARATALANKEKELERIRTAMKAKQPERIQDETLEATVAMLKEELEQTELDISILKEEHSLEIKVLQDEIASLQLGPGARSRVAYEIEDVSFSTDQNSSDSHVEPHSGDGATPAEESSAEEFESMSTDELGKDELGSDKSATDNSEPSQEPETITGWAAHVVSGLIDGVVSSLSGQESQSAESRIPDDHIAPVSESITSEETGEITIPAFPVFESLSDLFDFQNELPTEIEAAGLQALLNLSDDDFNRVLEMGFDSYDKIALLTSPEISLLATTLSIPESTIEKIWISGAQLRLYEGAS